MLSNSCKMLNEKPIRITPTSATLLDHIVTIDISNDIRSGIGTCKISDNLAVFSMIPILCKCMDAVKVIRDMSYFHTKQFYEELSYEMRIISKKKKKAIMAINYLKTAIS